MSKEIAVNDIVLKRGTEHTGTVIKISPMGWINVQWNGGKSNRTRPAICTPGELQKVNPEGAC